MTYKVHNILQSSFLRTQRAVKTLNFIQKVITLSHQKFFTFLSILLTYGFHGGIGCGFDEFNMFFIVIEERDVVKMVSPYDMKFSGNWHFRSCDHATFLSASQVAFYQAQGRNSRANKYAHINFPKPRPMHTWYAIWMLREPEWGLATFGTCFANTHFGLELDQVMGIVYIALDAPAKRIRSWRNGAVVAGMFNVGWYEMRVLPFTFRTRWTERRSKTKRRLSTNWC